MVLLFASSSPLLSSATVHSPRRTENRATRRCARRPRCTAAHAQVEAVAAAAAATDPSESSVSTLQSGRVRFRARFSYDGTNYCGWQYQPRQPTVQAAIEKQLARKLNGTVVRVVGASRTDSGVHARGQVAHFDIPAAAAAKQLGDAALLDNFEFTMNRMLPPDIRMYGLERAPLVPKRKPGTMDSTEDAAMFNAIYDVSSKLYSYRVSVARTPDPLERLYRFHYWRGVGPDFSFARLQSAADVFVGTHDFTAFANAGPKVPPGGVPAAVVTNPVRTVRSITVVDESNCRIRIDYVLEGGAFAFRILEGIRFLLTHQLFPLVRRALTLTLSDSCDDIWNVAALFRMVRNFTGAILEVGAGRLDVEELQEMLAAKDRQRAPRGSPAHGLCLERVFFDI